MERFPTALVYVLVFLGIIIFQSFLRRLQRRAEQARQGEAPPAAPAEEPLEDVWGRATAAPAAPMANLPRRPLASAIDPSAIRPRRAHPVRALLHGKRDLRRAVVLMMVLGPCRAQEPPER